MTSVSSRHPVRRSRSYDDVGLALRWDILSSTYDGKSGSIVDIRTRLEPHLWLPQRSDCRHFHFRVRSIQNERRDRRHSVRHRHDADHPTRGAVPVGIDGPSTTNAIDQLDAALSPFTGHRDVTLRYGVEGGRLSQDKSKSTVIDYLFGGMPHPGSTTATSEYDVASMQPAPISTCCTRSRRR